MLDFKSETIDYLIELGYNDTISSLRDVETIQKPLIQMKSNKNKLDDLMGKFPIE